MVYFFAGSERFLIEEALKKLKRSVADKLGEEPDFNVYYADEGRLQEALETASTVPLFSRRRLVVLKNIEVLNKDEKRVLLDYIKHPQKTAYLVLISCTDKSEGKFFQELRSGTKFFLFKPLQGSGIFVWIRERVQAGEKEISEKAVRILVENAGNDLRSLAGHLEKLFLYVDSRRRIEAEDVEMLVGESLNKDAFEMSKAIFRRDSKGALKILGKLLLDERKAPQFLGAIVWSLRWKSAGVLKKEGLKEALRLCLQTDVRIKRGGISSRTDLELLVGRLCNLI